MRAVLLAIAVLSGCAAAPGPAPDWRLAPAGEMADARHLIVTVPLADEAALARVAAALEADHPVRLAAEWPLASIDVHCFVFRIDDATTAAAAIASLSADARVRTVQPMQRFETSAAYSDELFAVQDGLAAMGVARAHAVATGRGVRVGIIDTGIDADHADLADRVAEARDLTAGTGTGAGEQHGTAVAAIVGADAKNGRGMVGVAPGAMLVGLRGCWEAEPGAPGQCSSFSLARALNLAVVQGIEVVNLSLGGPDDPLLAELVEAAADRGALVIAARGEGDSPAFPASHPAVVSVAADAPAPGADIAAPGTDVVSAAPGGDYAFYSGSSVAAAHVAGIAALARETDPALDAAAFRAALAEAGAGGMPDACAVLAALPGGAVCPPGA